MVPLQQDISLRHVLRNTIIIRLHYDIKACSATTESHLPSSFSLLPEERKIVSEIHTHKQCPYCTRIWHLAQCTNLPFTHVYSQRKLVMIINCILLWLHYNTPYTSYDTTACTLIGQPYLKANDDAVEGQWKILCTSVTFLTKSLIH